MNFLRSPSFAKIPTEKAIFLLRLLPGDSGEWLKDACALANAEGGYLFLGVQPHTLALRGMSLPEAQRSEKKILAAFKKLVPEPSLEASLIDYKELNGIKRWVLQLTIHEATQKPVFVSWRKMLICYVRRNGLTRPAEIEEMRALFADGLAHGAASSWSSFRLEGYSLLADSFQKSHRRPLTSGELHSRGFLDDEGKPSPVLEALQDERRSVPLRVGEHPEEKLSPLKAKERILGEAKEINTYTKWYPLDLTSALLDLVLFRPNLSIDLQEDRLFLSMDLEGELPDSLFLCPAEEKALYPLLFAKDFDELKGELHSLYQKNEGQRKPAFSKEGNRAFLCLYPFLLPQKEEEAAPKKEPETVPEELIPAEEEPAALNDREKEVLSFCASPRSASEIAKHLGLSLSWYFRENVLHSLIQRGFLASTEKNLRSRKTKYVALKQE